MTLADLKNATATKEPPDIVLSPSNIPGNFIELLVGFVDCFDWPAKCRGQYKHSTRDRNAVCTLWNDEGGRNYCA